MVTNEEDGGETQLSTRHLPRTSETDDDSARGTMEREDINIEQRQMQETDLLTLAVGSAMSRTLTHHETTICQG